MCRWGLDCVVFCCFKGVRRVDVVMCGGIVGVFGREGDFDEF